MWRYTFALCAILVAGSAMSAPPVRLVIHGGAGTMSRSDLTDEREAAIRADLERALTTGLTPRPHAGACPLLSLRRPGSST